MTAASLGATCYNEALCDTESAEVTGLIISASRRTDIPAFYAKWFMNRIRAGYCSVPNPFNPKQISTVSLAVEEVDAIMFWTRNPRPLFSFLQELEDRRYRYLVNFTLLNNPRLLDANCPGVEASIDTFRRLSERIGSERVIWRYDPIVFSNLTDAHFHRRNFEYIAKSIHGYTRRCVISIVQVYRKSARRLREIAELGLQPAGPAEAQLQRLMQDLSDIAESCAMEIFSCAQAKDFSEFGIKPGKCIDGDYLSKIFDVRLDTHKDPFQRPYCGCTSSKDIGMYDSCLYDCRYCYATSSHQRALKNHRRHHPDSTSLLGWQP